MAKAKKRKQRAYESKKKVREGVGLVAVSAYDQ
jgi:hypothetical protein